MLCSICESKYRHQIETALLNGDSLQDVLDNFSTMVPNLTLDHLKIHAVAHLKRTDTSTESIADKLSLKEADALQLSCNEYMATLQHLGSVIEHQLKLVEEEELTISQALSKPTVDLYLGTGSQIRETVKLLTEVYENLNSNEHTGKSSLVTLSEALERSRKQFRVV